MKNNKLILTLKEAPTPNGDVFILWARMMVPFTSTTPKETDLLAALLRKRHELSKNIKDDSLIDSVLFMTEKRNEIKNELGMSDITFNNTLALLKNKRNIITKDNRIISKIIPQFDDKGGVFEIVFNVLLYERK